ncbi:hypothetical protein ACHQM5_028346 [Ranunculus cassubicifolius]
MTSFPYWSTWQILLCFHDPNPLTTTRPPSVSAVLLREILPVVEFQDLEDKDNQDDSKEEIRRLTNCRHIFHRICLDRWMDHDQKTCPLCRTPFIPDDMQEAFNERLWAVTAVPDESYN